jgi:hypothetical protein
MKRGRRSPQGHDDFKFCFAFERVGEKEDREEGYIVVSL